ncbi:MAG TPA: DUF4136 domain-containing protein [Sphingorhabdus sp.]|jgi:hypothetical protein|uniref:DUF4136 domain-containing protein n=1 Tax=Sphingorhabdus sp. TaxID=1902408 RepID=UPI002B98AC4F|nr:DUF4136 domain-containing protein [Sphingorhabdus sp.]HMT41534.1 DUF4136 domain-containing protein [Sphingorhabdus sp.]HMU20920.1 DUF4136 domain-containing protein [Sphingorhabdus sp.]
MNPLRKAPLLLLPLLLSACMIPTGPVEVTRFNRVAEGIVYGSGSFDVAPVDGDSLALSPYMAAVQQEMERAGYTKALDGSDVVAEVSVQRVQFIGNERNPVSVGMGGSTGSYGSGVGVGVGVNLNALGDQRGMETTLSVRIIRTSDRLVIWEGRATQRGALNSPAAQPGIAAAKLAEALFKNFPGTNGETVTIP